MKNELVFIIILCFVCASQSDVALDALDNYKVQRVADSIKEIQQQHINDSLRTIAQNEVIVEDNAAKTIVIYNYHIDSMQLCIDTINAKLYNKCFKSMKNFDTYTKLQYIDYLLKYYMCDTSTCITWLTDFQSVIDIQYNMLYVVMNTQQGNTRATIHLHRQVILKEMTIVAAKIRSLSNI